VRLPLNRVVSRPVAREPEIRAFFAEGHPPAHRLPDWSAHVRTLGEDVPRVCLDVLENSDFTVHPAALYGLRAFGYDAWCEGSWGDERYKVRRSADDDWLWITPKSKSPRPGTA
jgi:hypothetical protein